MGIIGVGGMGGHHADVYAAHPRVQMKVVCDIDPAKAAAKAGELACEHATDAAAVLDRKDVDAVLVAVPNALHPALAADALRAGKHVSVEYPVAQTVEQFDQLCAQADSAGRVLHDALTPWIEPQSRTLAEHVSKIGTPLTTNSSYRGGEAGSWYVNEELRGNYFSALPIHMVVYWRVVFGERPEWIEATECFHGEGDRAVHATTYLSKYPSGLTAYNEWVMGIRWGGGWEWTVEGTDGRVVYDRSGEGHRLRIFTDAGEEVVDMPPQAQAHPADIDAFVRRVLDGDEPYVSREDSREILQICQWAEQSARQDRRVTCKW